MDEKQYYLKTKKEDEIDLRELFILIWRKKITIICITLIVAIITGLISIFLITPVYHSRLGIIINMPKVYNTKYGDYTLPITSNEQYISLITSNEVLLRTIEDIEKYENIDIEDLRESIIIEETEMLTNKEQNTFYVKVASDTPIGAQELAKTLYKNYIDFLEMLIIEGALNYYINNYEVVLQSSMVTLESTMEILAKNEALLAQTPQTINQKAAMNEINENFSSNDFVILENIINPNYIKIENDIITNKQTIDDIENSIKVYNDYLSELDSIKREVASYKEDDKFDLVIDELVCVAKTNIYLPSEPIVPKQKTRPSNVKNTIIGALLGGIIGVVVVFIKEYWVNVDEKRK